MSLVKSAIQGALTDALKQEINLFRASGKASSIDEEKFDPTASSSCFLGLTGQQGGINVDPYRDEIGRVPVDYGLGRHDNMTPLEIWSAYYWTRDKQKVLDVLRYVKGQSDTLPEVEYAEAVAA